MDPVPLFSFIVPVYNRETKIIHTLESIRNQSFTQIEIIVVDDGSTDHTGSVVESWKKTVSSFPVEYVKLQENGGPNVAKNFGAGIAKGEWLVFLDSDDLVTDGCLAYLKAFISRHEDAGLIMVPCIDLDGKVTNANPDYEGRVSFREYLAGKFPGEYLPVARKDLFNNICFQKDLRGGEGITWLQVARISQLYIIRFNGRIYDNHGSDRLSYRSGAFVKRVFKCHQRQLKMFFFQYLFYSPKSFMVLLAKYLVYFFRNLLAKSAN